MLMAFIFNGIATHHADCVEILSTGNTYGRIGWLFMHTRCFQTGLYAIVLFEHGQINTYKIEKSNSKPREFIRIKKYQK